MYLLNYYLLKLELTFCLIETLCKYTGELFFQMTYKNKFKQLKSPKHDLNH